MKTKYCKDCRHATKSAEDVNRWYQGDRTHVCNNQRGWFRLVTVDANHTCECFAKAK